MAKTKPVQAKTLKKLGKSNKKPKSKLISKVKPKVLKKEGKQLVESKNGKEIVKKVKELKKQPTVKITKNKEDKSRKTKPVGLDNDSVHTKTNGRSPKSKAPKLTKKLKKEAVSNPVNTFKIKLRSPKALKQEDSSRDVKAKNVVKDQFDNVTFTKNMGLDLEQIEAGANALLQLINIKEVKLFDEEQPIFLQVCCMKVPRAPKRHVRISLPHSILTDNSDICLIVSDGKNRKDYEGTIETYEKLLEEHDIKNVKTIMTFNQLKKEYTQYESLRTLVNLYDFFLVDGRIGGHVNQKLGKFFIQKRKQATSIRLNSKQLKQHFDEQIKKVIFNMHFKSDSSAFQVAHSRMTAEQIQDNIFEAVKQLDRHFPGGFKNVRMLSIKTSKSMDIPIFVSIKPKSAVKVPVVASKRPKKFTSVTGELSTYNNMSVTVLPTGEVITSGKMDREEDVEQEEEAVVSEEVKQEVKAKNKRKPTELKKEQGKDKKKTKIDNKVDEEEEEDDDILNKVEEMYLREYEENYLQSNKKDQAKDASPKKKVNKKRKVTEDQTEKITKKKKKVKTDKPQKGKRKAQ